MHGTLTCGKKIKVKLIETIEKWLSRLGESRNREKLVKRVL